MEVHGGTEGLLSTDLGGVARLRGDIMVRNVRKSGFVRDETQYMITLWHGKCLYVVRSRACVAVIGMPSTPGCTAATGRAKWIYR